MSRTSIIVATLGVIILFIGTAFGGYLAANFSVPRMPTLSLNPVSTPTLEYTQTEDTLPIDNSIDLFGTMLAFQSNLGFSGDRDMEALAQEGWLTLRNSDSYSTFVSRMSEMFTQNISLIKQTGFSSNRDIVAPFAWNVTQPTKDGAYDWDIPDRTLAAAGKAGITLSAVIQPFATWDTAERSDPSGCQGIDFVYFDYAAGKPVDMTAYKKWITAIVERYDYDGIDDMPGLITKVGDWEIGNEVEGQCGGTLINPDVYVSLLSETFKTIKATDPDALVLNAGALELKGDNGNTIQKTTDFWKNFFLLGGADYVDIFNMHYNRERAGAESTLNIYEEHLSFFRDSLDGAGHKTTPIWLTEYGTYSGAPKEETDPKGHARTFPSQTTEFQQSWFFRTVITGMSYGAERYFIDLTGNDNSPIGGSALFGNARTPRPFVTTLIMLGAQLKDASAIKEISNGQYRISQDGKTIGYALWNGTLPSELIGRTVTAYDVNGAKTSISADSLILDQSAPILVIL